MPLGLVERLIRGHPVDIAIFPPPIYPTLLPFPAPFTAAFHRLAESSRQMLQLAIECSGMHGSIAILDGADTVKHVGLPTDRSSVQSLAANVKTLVGNIGRSPDFISVTNGPGSFTGLRVGITTAKMLGLAWSLPIVAVDTLQVLAYQIVHRHAAPSQIIAVPVINAFRRQVFTSAWLARPDATIVPLSQAHVVDADVWVDQPMGSGLLEGLSQPELSTSEPADGHAELLPVSPADRRAALATTLISVGGPGLEVYRPNIQLDLQPNIPPSLTPNITSPNSSAKLGRPTVQIVEGVNPDAQWVGRIGWQLFQAGQTHSPETHIANYVRASAAEEKLSR